MLLSTFNSKFDFSTLENLYSFDEIPSCIPSAVTVTLLITLPKPNLMLYIASALFPTSILPISIVLSPIIDSIPVVFSTLTLTLFAVIVPVFFTTTFILTVCPSLTVVVPSGNTAESSADNIAPFPVDIPAIADVFVSAIVPIEETLL